MGVQKIGLAKEVESPENPGALEKRVALTPEDVGHLVAAGLDVAVEEGAGEGIGFSDAEYAIAGASLETHDELYAGKDMVIKFKGPSLESIDKMAEGTILFCMAHFSSYPDRAKMLEDHKITVLAMEEILESPKVQTDEEILGRTAMAEALAPFIATGVMNKLKINVLDWNPLLRYAIRRAGNRDPKSLSVVQSSLAFNDLSDVGPDCLYIYDGSAFKDSHKILSKLKAKKTHLFDIAEFISEQGEESIEVYREDHNPFDFGLRRIQCLHETGMAGARYGVKLLSKGKPHKAVKDIKALVLGYGNVAQGAIRELFDQGVREIHILGRKLTQADAILPYLEGADLIVNGAEQPPELRGKNFLITNDHLKHSLEEGSVVIDLVGGSETNRSPVEPVIACTFLTDPHFVQDGVYVSALWGWPMLGMMKESAVTYSSLIKDVLIGHEKIAILEPKDYPKGVERALVCGPF
ncbi:hypothetical protein QGN29_11025 [Temperatibacter marinus]|uniref:Alanine dehydrogenase/pyridine nucleotide transhydrogenase N-terminal domain-containing protein n=1 Tax=Temperatibacter marinus TaxID=1456591 RepID=A0AA52EFW9_9PROT|nr:hypothetical protein [Temperatibacter marinus]WND02080.1 hypothetical protein QGN29_11025 [Temperatibacter marinus]